jgi:hypothetical protein
MKGQFHAWKTREVTLLALNSVLFARGSRALASRRRGRLGDGG